MTKRQKSLAKKIASAYNSLPVAEVAQLVEHLVVAQVAVGSSPIIRPTFWSRKDPERPESLKYKGFRPFSCSRVLYRYAEFRRPVLPSLRESPQALNIFSEYPKSELHFPKDAMDKGFRKGQ